MLPCQILVELFESHFIYLKSPILYLYLSVQYIIISLENLKILGCGIEQLTKSVIDGRTGS